MKGRGAEGEMDEEEDPFASFWIDPDEAEVPGEVEAGPDSAVVSIRTCFRFNVLDSPASFGW